MLPGPSFVLWRKVEGRRQERESEVEGKVKDGGKKG